MKTKSSKNLYHKWSIRDTARFHSIIKENPTISIKELSEMMGYCVATIQCRLEKFGYEKGWIRR